LFLYDAGIFQRRQIGLPPFDCERQLNTLRNTNATQPA
jgi:hypothetical protein